MVRNAWTGTGSLFFGRLTICGEYLMHDWPASGLVLKAPLFLAAGIVGVPMHKTYNSDLDPIRKELEKMGLSVDTRIQGDLPLGAGFASSTVLALLHVGRLRWTVEEVKGFVMRMDRRVHGFEPSGLDFAAIVSASGGIFGRGEWADYAIACPYHLAVLFKHEIVDRAPLLRLLRNDYELLGLSMDLVAASRECGFVDSDALANYCAALLCRPVYTKRQIVAVAAFASYGVPCKGVGGLLGKALVAFFPADKDASWCHAVSAEVAARSGLTVVRSPTGSSERVPSGGSVPDLDFLNWSESSLALW